MERIKERNAWSNIMKVCSWKIFSPSAQEPENELREWDDLKSLLRFIICFSPQARRFDSLSIVWGGTGINIQQWSILRRGLHWFIHRHRARCFGCCRDIRRWKLTKARGFSAELCAGLVIFTVAAVFGARKDSTVATPRQKVSHG